MSFNIIIEVKPIQTKLFDNVSEIEEQKTLLKIKMKELSTALCILFYSSVSSYVGLYGSGFGSYVSFPTLFACFLGFDIPTSSFIFIGNVFLLFLFVCVLQCVYVYYTYTHIL